MKNCFDGKGTWNPNSVPTALKLNDHKIMWISKLSDITEQVEDHHDLDECPLCNYISARLRPSWRNIHLDVHQISRMNGIIVDLYHISGDKFSGLSIGDVRLQRATLERRHADTRARNGLQPMTIHIWIIVFDLGAILYNPFVARCTHSPATNKEQWSCAWLK